MTSNHNPLNYIIKFTRIKRIPTTIKLFFGLIPMLQL